MLLVGVPVLALSLAGLIALWRDERRQRQAVEFCRARRRQLDRDTRQAVRQVRRRYQAAASVALSHAARSRPAQPNRHPERSQP